MKYSFLNFLKPGLALLLGNLLCSFSTYGADFSALPAPPASLPSNSFELNAPLSVLPADSAFALNVLVELPNSIVLMWDIREGYYLYRKSLKFSLTEQEQIEDATIPDGDYVSDEFFGEAEVYYTKLLVKIPLESINPSDKSEVQLLISYQGCAEVGFCYPMQHKLVNIKMP